MKIGIIGGGIIGFTTGLVLARAGYRVEVLSRDAPEKTTSWAAAALAYPINVEETPRCIDWFLRSHEVLSDIKANPAAGVTLVDWFKYSRKEGFEAPFWFEHCPDARLLGADECIEGFVSGVAARLYLMDVDSYFPWVVDAFKAAGGVCRIGDIDNLNLVSCDFDVVINASGAFAKALVGDDSVQPARGQVVIIKNPDLHQCFSIFREKTYVYPRGETCLVGGSYDVGDWSMSGDDQLTQDILSRAAAIEPRIRDAEILDVRVGLRPLRPEVRLERGVLNDGRPVIHNYGHGGCGYTLSWGCAEEVLRLVGGL